MALVEEHGEELARLETGNVGKPISDSRGEVQMVAEVFYFYAGAVDKHHGETIPVAGGVDLTFREPLGVVGLIVPWNFPIAISSWKLGPALACGNTVVLKPAELTPLTAVRFAELALDAEIPEGVVNVLTGPGAVVGKRLVEHPDVAKIGFTGSTEVGRGVMEGAAGTIKRVTLELGGKSANIVFSDADLDAAAAGAPYAVFGNAGQDCCARSRILVQRSAYDRFLELLVEWTAGVRVGDPEADETEMGPLISAAQREKVSSYADGNVVFRGNAPDSPGFWFPCTLVEATNEDPVAREEVFGPVAAVIPFEDEAEAVRIANDTPDARARWLLGGQERVHRDRGGLELGRLDGKVAVITGAGGGMGREAALLFSEEGASVCVADVDGEAAEQTAAETRGAFAVQVDVADGESVRAMYAATADRYGGIDVLYNNAGISPAEDDSILETDEDAWQRVQDVNTKGVYLCCKHGIPYLLERGGGSVINVASFVALVGAATSQISYTASKGRSALDVT